MQGTTLQLNGLALERDTVYSFDANKNIILQLKEETALQPA